MRSASTAGRTSMGCTLAGTMTRYTSTPSTFSLPTARTFESCTCARPISRGCWPAGSMVSSCPISSRVRSDRNCFATPARWAPRGQVSGGWAKGRAPQIYAHGRIFVLSARQAPKRSRTALMRCCRCCTCAADQRITVVNDRQADGVQAGRRRIENLAAAQRHKSFAEGHRRCQIQRWHRGHPGAGKSRRLIASSPKIPHSSMQPVLKPTAQRHQAEYNRLVALRIKLGPQIPSKLVSAQVVPRFNERTRSAVLPRAKRDHLKRIETGQYQSVRRGPCLLVAMTPISGFREASFLLFHAMNNDASG